MTALPEVPFPAEYAIGPAGKADGRRMTHEENAAALQRADYLVRRGYRTCTRKIAAFDRVGPFLVGKAQERLRLISLPEYGQEPVHVVQAQQIEAEIEHWLSPATTFVPLLAAVSVTMNVALTKLMVRTIKQMRALPIQRTALPDTVSIVAAYDRLREAFESGDANLLDAVLAQEVPAALDKLTKNNEDLARAQDHLDTMAQCGLLAGFHVAATFQAIAGYLDSRNAYLVTYLEATDYFKAVDDAGGIVLRAGATQFLYGAITTAIGQYGPLILPKVLARTPVIGGGFAIVDVARTVNEKRKLVEERRSHLMELAEARQGRGAVSEMAWLDGRLKDDRDTLDELVRATIEMCDGLKTLAEAPQSD
ncbi:hypothetical protein KGQ20_34110 [Catenulispora sp. NF23]|uniref:Uncharacterized protein n=1 Tax=Catenulispora pinistramenti TaxID=2705254 RepID=A0ABS5L5L5_9ACTN|nr:hypothetical protein [Catenulispora pinistramenti]MBS2537800.1 hypothetical protein [Catenulispora pinistramenti]MBS2553540.1 hypothetical protein [Catenulispora pinistramenti]